MKQEPDWLGEPAVARKEQAAEAAVGGLGVEAGLVHQGGVLHGRGYSSRQPVKRRQLACVLAYRARTDLLHIVVYVPHIHLQCHSATRLADQHAKISQATLVAVLSYRKVKQRNGGMPPFAEKHPLSLFRSD